VSIPFYGGHLLADDLMARAEPYLEQVLDEGWYVNGTIVGELERRIAARLGVEHCVGVGSGSDALVLLLEALGVGPGDEVVVPAYTFVSSATAVAHVGATPVFADIDPVTRNVSTAEVERRLTARTKAVMPVHMLLQMAPMDEIVELCRGLSLLVVEDSAEAIGFRLHDRAAGAWGHGGVLSFFPSKTLGARGDGGAVVTSDERIADEVRLRRNHGNRGAIPYLWETPGVNSRLDSVQAALLLAALDRLDSDIAERWRLADAYSERLEGLAGVDLPQLTVGEGVPYVYLIEVADRDALVAKLAGAGIEVEVYYPVPLHLQPVFADLGHAPGDLPHAERLCSRAVALPLYPGLPLSAVERTAGVVAEHAGLVESRGR
jgi:UDP-2-acetamido-2-deoxy-ribo-hexuluronate aminotransferase